MSGQKTTGKKVPYRRRRERPHSWGFRIETELQELLDDLGADELERDRRTFVRSAAMFLDSQSGEVFMAVEDVWKRAEDLAEEGVRRGHIGPLTTNPQKRGTNGRDDEDGPRAGDDCPGGRID